MRILINFRSNHFKKRNIPPFIYNFFHNSSLSTSSKYYDLTHLQTSSIIPKFSLSDFILLPNHFTLQEQTFLSTHSLTKLKRIFGKRTIYQSSHFDHIIHNYRECQVTNWTTGDNEIEREINNLLIQKVYNLFPKEINWLPIHILELAESIGGIKPHVDNVEYSGNIVAGICLISPTVMILRHVNNPECKFSVLLEPGCLYIQRDTVRYNFTHEIPIDPEQHKFKSNLIPKGQRISLMFRVCNK
ncbi:17797_t:CDS:2 [Funneliformis geosporum]|nr:17797_t:CDS:2 [Funneliformis geosporum]